MDFKAPKNNFRVTVTIIDLQPTNLFTPSKGNGTNDEFTLLLALCGISKNISLPSKDSYSFDFEKAYLGSKINFEIQDTQGNSYGVAEIPFPSNIINEREVQITEELRFFSAIKEKDYIKAKISLNFINKTNTAMQKQQQKKVFKTVTKSILDKKSSLPIKTLSGSPVKKLEARNSVDNPNEKALQEYLHNVITRESDKLRTIVDEHNSINECVHLNRVNKNLPKSFAENSLHYYSPQRFSYNEEDNNANSLSQSLLVARNSVPSLKTPPKKPARTNSRDKSLEKTLKGYYSGLTKEDVIDELKRNASDNSLNNSAVLANSQTGSQKSNKRQTESAVNNSRTIKRSVSPIKSLQQTPKQVLQQSNISDKFGSAKERKYKSQVEFLNQVIVNIEARLKKNDVIKQENNKLKAEVEACHEDRKILQDSIDEATKQFKEEAFKIQKQNGDVIHQKGELVSRNRELLSRIQELEQALEQAKVAISQKDNQLTKLNTKVEELTESRNTSHQLESLRKALDRSEQKRAEEQKAYLNNLERLEKALEDLQSMTQELSKEKNDIRKELQQTRQELDECKSENSQLKNDLAFMERKLSHAQEYRNVIASLEDQRDTMSQRLNEAKRSLTQTEKLLERANQDFATKLRESEIREKQQVDELVALKDKLKNYEIRNNQLSQELDEIELKNLELNSVKSVLDRTQALAQDLKKERDDILDRLNQANEDKKILNQQIDTLAQNHKEMNDKALELQNDVVELQSALKQNDSQIQSLCQLAEEIEDDNTIYIPQKNDPIDSALADYINTAKGSKGLKLLFMRECEGVYQFGSRKIYIKIEGDKILSNDCLKLFRVGGGYLTIDEFIKQNASSEFERLAKNDPVKLLSRNLAINKVIVGKCVNCIEKSKTSPYACS